MDKETNLIITPYQPQKKQKLLGIAIFSTKFFLNMRYYHRIWKNTLFYVKTRTTFIT